MADRRQRHRESHVRGVIRIVTLGHRHVTHRHQRQIFDGDEVLHGGLGSIEGSHGVVQFELRIVGSLVNGFAEFDQERLRRIVPTVFDGCHGEGLAAAVVRSPCESLRFRSGGVIIGVVGVGYRSTGVVGVGYRSAGGGRVRSRLIGRGLPFHAEGNVRFASGGGHGKGEGFPLVHRVGSFDEIGRHNILHRDGHALSVGVAVFIGGPHGDLIGVVLALIGRFLKVLGGH